MADTIGNVWPRNSSAMLSFSVPMNPSQTKGWWYLFEDDLSLLPLPGLIFGRTNYNFFRILDQYSTYWHRICSHDKLYCARISQWTMENLQDKIWRAGRSVGACLPDLDWLPSMFCYQCENIS